MNGQTGFFFTKPSFAKNKEISQKEQQKNDMSPHARTGQNFLIDNVGIWGPEKYRVLIGGILSWNRDLFKRRKGSRV